MDESTYEATVTLCENWGRWAREGGSEPHGRCGSIEGRYLREKVDEEKLKREARMPIDVEEALRVEAAVLKIRGRRIRALLIGRFVNGRTREELCRKLRLDWNIFDACIRRAVYEVRDKLERAKLWGVIRGRVKQPPALTPT